MFITLTAALIVGSASSTVADFKCNQPPGSETLYSVDGRLLESAADPALADLHRSDLHAVEILCMNQDSTYDRHSGVTVVSVWTNSGPVSAMKPALAAIADAQAGYFRRHSEYADRIEDLGAPSSYPSQFQISLDVREDRWRATIRMNGYLGVCFAYGGAGAAPIATATPNQPECVYDRAVPPETLEG